MTSPIVPARRTGRPVTHQSERSHERSRLHPLFVTSRARRRAAERAGRLEVARDDKGKSIMRFVPLAASSCILAAACAPSGAVAATVAFSGSQSNINLPGPPGGPCPASLQNLKFGPADTSGTSNFGSFTFGRAHCAVGGPGPYSGGVFQYFFSAGDGFSGTYSGVLAPSDTTGLLNNSINYIVTGGTVRFLGASGVIDGVGTVDLRNQPVRAFSVLSGRLDLPAVPEPASLALIIAGSGMVGGMMRLRAKGPAIAGV